MRWLAASILLLLSLSARAVTPYADTGELTVTSEGYVIANQSTEATNIVSINQRLFVSFFGCDAYPCTSSAGGFRARSYNLLTSSWDASAAIFPTVALTEATSGNNDYHHTPSIGLQNTGRIAYFANTAASFSSCGAQSGVSPPFVRAATASQWNAPDSTETTCLSGGVNLDSGHSATDTNDSSVTASGAGVGTSYTINDVGTVSLADGSMIAYAETGKPYASSHAGLHASIWRRSAGGSWSGPFVLFHAIGNYQPTAGTGCSNPQPAQVFAKTKLVVRGSTVYAVLAPRRNIVSDETPLPNQGRHSLIVSAAKSVDGGVTWTDLGGGHSWTPSAVTKDAPAWNDANYQVYTGDMDEYGQDSWDVDSQGRLAIAISPFVSGTQDFCGHPDTQNAANVFGLSILRQTASGWSTYTIDATNDWQAVAPAMMFDANDRLWLFKPKTTWSPTGMAYAVSSDGGQTFSAWTTITADAYADRIVSFFDPMRRWLAFTYYNNVTRQLYARKIDFLAPPTACCKP